VSRLNETELNRLLADDPFVSQLVVLNAVESTNDEVRRRALAGAAEGLVVLAATQTAGRGRLGRRWHSVPGAGLYLSVLLIPAEPAGQVTRWSLAAALAAAVACREVSGADVRIKWPNDLLCGSRKLGGVLAELRSSGRRTELVLGLGLNVSHRAGDFPPELTSRATSLRLLGADAGLTRETLAAACLGQLGQVVREMRQAGWESVASRWLDLAPGARGARVRVANAAAGGSQAFVGRTCGIDSSGALLVRREDGGTERVSAADSVFPEGT